MKNYFYLSILFITLILFTGSCGGGPSANSNANVSVNAVNGNAAQPSNSKPAEPTVNNAPTLTPVVEQFYDALKNKDDAKLKETLTADFEKQIEGDMQETKEKSIAVYVAKTDYRPGEAIEVRNEKINGNRATAEIRGGAYKNWTAFDFALENGKWRFTGGSPDIENMPKSNVNSTR
jgi:hypothetical protein